jgi:hypothetical protein
LMPRRFFWICVRLELVSESKLVVLSSVLENTVHNWNDDFWQNTNAWGSSLGFFHPQFSSRSTATFLTFKTWPQWQIWTPFSLCYLLPTFCGHCPLILRVSWRKYVCSFNFFYFRFCSIDIKPIRWYFIW